MDLGQRDGFRAETRKAIDIVVEALKLVSRSVTAADVASKGERDIVTSVDIAVEDLIRRDLTPAFGIPVIGEERGGETPAGGTPYWLVDPICGTRNLASGIPLYCINLALVEMGVVTVAIVGDPATQKIGFAEQGKGAWELKEGEYRRLSSSDASETIVIEEVKSNDDRRDRAVQFIAAAIRTDRWDFRSFGSTVGLLHLASGGISAYSALRASSVHGAAGALVAIEAGATVTDIEGRAWTVDSDSLLGAASDDLHADLLDLVQAAAKSR